MSRKAAVFPLLQERPVCPWLFRRPYWTGADKAASDSDDAATTPFWDWCPGPGEQCPDCISFLAPINSLFETPAAEAIV